MNKVKLVRGIQERKKTRKIKVLQGIDINEYLSETKRGFIKGPVELAKFFIQWTLIRSDDQFAKTCQLVIDEVDWKIHHHEIQKPINNHHRWLSTI